MRTLAAILLILSSSSLFSQDVRKKKAVIKKPSFYDYFCSRGLDPDSAATPWLLYQVHDWAGTRYKYSGDTKKGIDCSGFVSQMYAGTYCIPLSGGSKDLWTCVCPVEKKELKEGDLLFFKIKKGQISHVGIYLGNNKFALASVKSGVIVSDLNDDYYKKYFYKGGRVEQGNID
ncbi:MAG TPA: NlpC/P60 family protein [Bacteroidia bacterium]|jgi:lipoprotein Spr